MVEILVIGKFEATQSFIRTVFLNLIFHNLSWPTWIMKNKSLQTWTQTFNRLYGEHSRILLSFHANLKW